MEKIVMYTLCAKLEDSKTEKYTVIEGKNDYLKRGQTLMYYENFEGLDKMTSEFASFEEINETFKNMYNSSRNLYCPVIYADEQNENNHKNLFYTTDVVYTDDAKELENRIGIKQWLLDYLTHNPNDIAKFSGINEIYGNLKRRYPAMGIVNLINNTIKIYFNEENYVRYREAYFKLKELDYKRVKKDEIYR